MWVFLGLVVAVGHRRDHDSGAFAEVEQRRADEVPDVLDDDDRPRVGIELGERPGHHCGIEVAARASIDLDCARTGGADPLGVVIRRLVPFDDGDRDVVADVADGPLEEGCLARARRTHQIDGHDTAGAEPVARVCREAVVPFQDPLLERHRAPAWGQRVVVRMIRPVFMIVGVVLIRASARAAHVRTLPLRRPRSL